MKEPIGRRKFLASSFGFVVAPSALAIGTDCGKKTTNKSISEKMIDDNVATALKYTLEKEVAKKNKKYVEGSNCSNCKFYKADKAEPHYGTCALAGLKYVKSCGWCALYKKQKA